MRLFIHSQTSTVAPLKFVNGNTLLIITHYSIVFLISLHYEMNRTVSIKFLDTSYIDFSVDVSKTHQSFPPNIVEVLWYLGMGGTHR